MPLLRRSKHLVMGILNITPDSFSDGGESNRIPQLEEKIAGFLSQSVYWVDIGAQSTAPSSRAISGQEEIDRWRSIFFPAYLDNFQKWQELILSIDTYRPETFRFIYQWIVQHNPCQKMIWNDISGILDQEALELLRLVCPNADYVLAHNLVPTREQCGEHLLYCNQNTPSSQIIAQEVAFFQHAQETIKRDGRINPERIIFDPGFGFAKTRDENLELLARIGELCSAFLPHQRWLIGLSRKSFLRYLTRPDDLFSPHRLKLECLQAGLLGSFQQKYAHYSLIYRVHDPAVVQSLQWEQKTC